MEVKFEDIQDPELKALFAKYDREFNKEQPKPVPARKPMRRPQPGARRARCYDPDGSLRYIQWEYS